MRARIYAHVKESLYSAPSASVSVDNRLDNGYKIYRVDICLTGSSQSDNTVKCCRYGIPRNLNPAKPSVISHTISPYRLSATLYRTFLKRIPEKLRKRIKGNQEVFSCIFFRKCPVGIPGEREVPRRLFVSACFVAPVASEFPDGMTYKMRRTDSIRREYGMRTRILRV